MTRFPVWCCLLGGLTVLWLATAAFGLEPLDASRGTDSHRVIPPTQSTGSPPTLNDFMSPELLELFQEYQKLHRAQVADEQQRGDQAELPEPHFAPTPVPEALAPDARELAQRLSTGTHPSMASGMLKDIKDVAEKLNQQLQARLPEGTTVPTQEFPLPPMMETQGVLRQIMEQVQEQHAQAQRAYQHALEQYGSVWPSNGIPPREWIQKVQPFINQELVRQLAEARTDRSQKSPSDSFSPLSAGSSASSASRLSGSPSKSERHSNAVVESWIKAFDSKSTALIKAATNRKPKPGQSWWKSLSAQSKNKLAAWNRQLATNSRELARQQSSYFRSNSATTRYSNLDGSSLTGGGRYAIWIAGLLLLSIVVGIASFARHQLFPSPRHTASWRPPDASTIHDRDSLLRACHQLALELFGASSRFWNHRQLFARLAADLDVEPHSVRQLERIYEHARYAADGRSMAYQDVRTARRLFADLQDSRLVTQ